MMAGKRPLVEVNIYMALLRHSLEPPVTWFNSEAIVERLEALLYLKRCADGVETYSPEAMKNAMPKIKAVVAKPRDGTLAATMQSLAVAGETGEATPKKLAIQAARPWARAVTNLVSPTSSSNKRKAASEPSPPEKERNPKNKKRASPRGKTTPKVVIRKPAVVGSSIKHNSAARAQGQADSPTSSLRRAQRKNAGGDAKHLAGGSVSTLLANIFRATEVLNHVSRYEDACVRRVALSAFVADLEKAGWSDLEKSAAQLIKDDNPASREFLANMIIKGSYERINEALEKDAEPARTERDGGLAPGRCGPRILFRSG
ncbi:hypothetical protein LX36DRAFT_648070 [Colletotrichum falcatum]|nr:hypothetical protein LX36DRAFT_648070 [Colletotrichum falcatum]